MAAATTELQVIIFDYVLAKVAETNKLLVEAIDDSAKLEEFVIAFSDLEERRSEFMANYFALCAVPPRDELRKITDIKEAFADFEKHFRHFRLQYNKCTVRQSDLLQREPTPRAVLPALALPAFSGNRAEWNSFSQLFQSIVHQDISLTNVQKLHYLISCLKDEPRDLVRNLPLTNENYDVVWSLLEQRYKNARITATIHVQEILHLPSVITKSPVSMTRFVSYVNEHLNALKAEGFPVDEWSFLLLNILLEKLDSHLRQEFEMSMNEEMPTCVQLLKFLERKAVACEHVQLVNSHGTSAVQGVVNQHYTKGFVSGVKAPLKASTRSTTLVAVQGPICTLCKQSHLLHNCEQFSAKHVQERVKYVKTRSLCFNCLKPNHSAQKCLSKHSCKHCHKKHHSLLHYSNSNQDGGLTSETPSDQAAGGEGQCSGAKQALHLASDHCQESTILLSTAIVCVRDASGDFQTVRALLDGASQISFMTESCVQRLGLPRQRQDVEIAGVGQNPVSGSRGVAQCSIKAVGAPDIQFTTKMTILKHITHSMPGSKISLSSVKHLKDLKLADPTFDVPGPIDVLLAADIVGEAMTGAKLCGNPSAFHSVFGWIVVGKAKCKAISNPSVSFLVRTLSLDVELQRFWEVEEVPQANLVSSEERKCEEHYMTTYERSDDGRYILQLPFKEDPNLLGESLNNASTRFTYLEKKLDKSPYLADEYRAFMKEYEELGHMSRVADVLQCPDKGCIVQQDTALQADVKYVIPHHAVYKETSSTTKVRVVFDGSAPTSSGHSLNNLLFTGPKLQRDISEIILNFRTTPVAFTADICKMYRQVLIHSADRKYQHILWRASKQEEVHLYQLNTVTYGLASSPYQALRTLQQLAIDEAKTFPRASQVVLKNVFVDDVVTGASSSAEAIQLKLELVSLLARGGFELRKWSSNDPCVLLDVPEDSREMLRSFDDEASPVLKVLGIHWAPETDIFTYHINMPELSITKRGILSTIARLFDPCGWVSPVVVFVKILLQTLWTLGLDWDQPVPEDVSQQWNHFKANLPSLVRVKIPRYLNLSDPGNLSWHGFCDASEKAYAAAIYVRYTDKSGCITTHLLIAKSKVAPLKTISVPRLELCGMLLLARLWQYMCKRLCDTPKQSEGYLWSDSSTALLWIKSSPHKFKAFVANRVSEIQNITPPSMWRYVPSASNPADLASRGVCPDQLVDNSLWFQGPDWLSESESAWPVNRFEVPDNPDLSECKPCRDQVFVVHENACELQLLLEKYSSFSKLKRVTAWLLRSKNAFFKRPHSKSEILLREELDTAVIFWLHVVQQQHFSEEIKCIQSGKLANTLKSLCPFIDSLGVLRVGGRLQNSLLPASAKHPAVLPAKSYLSVIIVNHYHVLYLHSGPQVTHSLIQRHFWIVGARRLIKQCIHQCVQCFKVTPKNPEPVMGDLPISRFSQVRPFLNVGVDFAGPFTTKIAKTRMAALNKSYLCVFICMSTKAVHFEVVSTLSTEGFLAALKRFVAIRGTPAEMFSDQGTNFVGASRYLNEILQKLRTEPSWSTLQRHLTELHIVWHFNPPAGPHFGGLWEAAVKSAKGHMKRVVGDQVLTYEELATLFAEVSAIMNSRPLCPLSTDPAEFDVLTPGHFLVGGPLVGLPEHDLSHIAENRLDRWQLIMRLKQSIWKRWSQDYLHTLHQRTKWNASGPNVKMDALVLLKDPNLPSLKWRTARVVQTHPGKDGIVRVVTVKTPTGECVRPVTKICPLPIN